MADRCELLHHNAFNARPHRHADWPDLALCFACPDPQTHKLRLWYPHDEPERPLDLHGVFERGCEGCDRAWAVLRLPRHDLPEWLDAQPV